MAEATLHQRARESFASEADINEFVQMLERFERGEISSETWRKFRLVRGTYGQRQDDVQMLRVKIPQGVLTTAQLDALADVAERYSRGFAHVTTRQNIQFHFMRLGDVERAMRRLADEGLTTREACGNSVRNITACPFAGVSRHEVFDVTPYAEALTRYLLRHPLSSRLPRKFKIAFEGCRDDHIFTAINDLGWTARIVEADGQLTRGFRLTAGGGTSILPTSGRVLFEFLPANEMLNVAEAVVRVFHRLGDHEHKHRNRMKFLIKSLGWDRWRDEVLATLEEVRAEGGARLSFDPEHPPVETAPDWQRPPMPSLEWIRDTAARTTVSGPGLTPGVTPTPWTEPAYRAWRASNVHAQRQAGFSIAVVRLVLGDITAGQLRALHALADALGDGSVRVTADQNMFVRWVPDSSIAELFAGLAAAGLGSAGASTIADVTSCPGAESCKLAVTQSRGLGRVLADTLAGRPDLVQLAEGANIKISGCPNGCGQHHIATLGFQGSVRKVDGRAVPQYFVMVGGEAVSNGATFGRLSAKIPARRIGTAVERLLDLYRRERHDNEAPQAFFRRLEVSAVKQLLSDLESFRAEDATAEDYVDLGETTAFVPEVQEGECAT